MTSVLNEEIVLETFHFPKSGDTYDGSTVVESSFNTDDASWFIMYDRKVSSSYIRRNLKHLIGASKFFTPDGDKVYEVSVDRAYKSKNVRTNPSSEDRTLVVGTIDASRVWRNPTTEEEFDAEMDDMIQAEPDKSFRRHKIDKLNSAQGREKLWSFVSFIGESYGWHKNGEVYHRRGSLIAPKVDITKKVKNARTFYHTHPSMDEPSQTSADDIQLYLDCAFSNDYTTNFYTVMKDRLEHFIVKAKEGKKNAYLKIDENKLVKDIESIMNANELELRKEYGPKDRGLRFSSEVTRNSVEELNNRYAKYFSISYRNHYRPGVIKSNPSGGAAFLENPSSQVEEFQSLIDNNEYLKGNTVTPIDLVQSDSYVLFFPSDYVGHIKSRHLDPNAPGSLFIQDVNLQTVAAAVMQHSPDENQGGRIKWLGTNSGQQIGYMGVAAAQPETVSSYEDYTMTDGRNEQVKVLRGQKRAPTNEVSLVTSELGPLSDGRTALSIITMFPGGEYVSGVRIPVDRNEFTSAGLYFVLPNPPVKLVSRVGTVDNRGRFFNKDTGEEITGKMFANAKLDTTKGKRAVFEVGDEVKPPVEGLVGFKRRFNIGKWKDRTVIQIGERSDRYIEKIDFELPVLLEHDPLSIGEPSSFVTTRGRFSYRTQEDNFTMIDGREVTNFQGESKGHSAVPIPLYKYGKVERRKPGRLGGPVTNPPIKVKEKYTHPVFDELKDTSYNQEHYGANEYGHSLWVYWWLDYHFAIDKPSGSKMWTLERYGLDSSLRNMLRGYLGQELAPSYSYLDVALIMGLYHDIGKKREKELGRHHSVVGAEMFQSTIAPDNEIPKEIADAITLMMESDIGRRNITEEDFRNMIGGYYGVALLVRMADMAAHHPHMFIGSARRAKMAGDIESSNALKYKDSLITEHFTRLRTFLDYHSRTNPPPIPNYISYKGDYEVTIDFILADSGLSKYKFKKYPQGGQANFKYEYSLGTVNGKLYPRGVIQIDIKKNHMTEQDPLGDALAQQIFVEIGETIAEFQPENAPVIAEEVQPQSLINPRHASNVKLITISGPSGTGKSTFLRTIADVLDASMVPTYTSRSKRAKEKPGGDRVFVTKEKFVKMIKNGEFVEYQKEKNGHFYGRRWADFKAKKYAVVDVTLSGMRTYREKFPFVYSVFLFPDISKKEMYKRLMRRGGMSEKEAKQRVRIAALQIKQAKRMDFDLFLQTKSGQFEEQATKLSEDVENFFAKPVKQNPQTNLDGDDFPDDIHDFISRRLADGWKTFTVERWMPEEVIPERALMYPQSTIHKANQVKVFVMHPEDIEAIGKDPSMVEAKRKHDINVKREREQEAREAQERRKRMGIQSILDFVPDDDDERHSPTGSVEDNPKKKKCPTPLKKGISIYGASWCPYCIKAKKLAEDSGMKYRYTDIDECDNFAKVIPPLADNYQYIPIVFVGGKFIGGYDGLLKYVMENLMAKWNPPEPEDFISVLQYRFGMTANYPNFAQMPGIGSDIFPTTLKSEPWAHEFTPMRGYHVTLIAGNLLKPYKALIKENEDLLLSYPPPPKPKLGFFGVAIRHMPDGEIRKTVFSEVTNSSEFRTYTNDLCIHLGFTNPDPDRYYHMSVANNHGGDPFKSVGDIKPSDLREAW